MTSANVPLRFSPTEDQRVLGQMLREFLEARGQAVPVAPSCGVNSPDPRLWREMSQSLGLAGIAVPVQFGGVGASFAEVCVVLSESGRVLLTSPFLGTSLGVVALLASHDESACAEMLSSVAERGTSATVALSGCGGNLVADSVDVSGTQQGDGWRLSGRTALVVDGTTADLVLVIADTPAGKALFAVEANAEGMSRSSMPTLDLTRPLAAIVFSDTPAKLCGAPGDGWRIAEIVRDYALVGLAAEQVAAARRCLDMAVDYAQTRIQFGRQIGSFQAIKHRCAEMLLRIDAGDATAAAASWTAAYDSDALPSAAALAAATCAEAAIFAAEENIQIHGGIGYTWEHPAHLYFRRALSSAHLFGSPGDARERLLRQAGV